MLQHRFLQDVIAHALLSGNRNIGYNSLNSVGDVASKREPTKHASKKDIAFNTPAMFIHRI